MTTYLASCIAVSFISFVLSLVATFLPYWAFFDDGNNGGYYGSDRGHFGVWTVCKELTYDRTKCGTNENSTRFRPSIFVFISGVAVTIGAIALGICVVISIIQLIAHKRGGNPSKPMANLKLILAAIAALTTLGATGLFAAQTDFRGFRVSFGVSFYLVLVNTLLTIVLSILCLYGVVNKEPTPTVETDVHEMAAKRSRKFGYERPLEQ